MLAGDIVRVLYRGDELLAAGNAPGFCPSDVAKSSFLGTPH